MAASALASPLLDPRGDPTSTFPVNCAVTNTSPLENNVVEVIKEYDNSIIPLSLQINPFGSKCTLIRRHADAEMSLCGGIAGKSREHIVEAARDILSKCKKDGRVSGRRRIDDGNGLDIWIH